MTCRICGAEMRAIATDLPFKITESAIVVIKDLPVRQCEGCTEYLLDDVTLARVDELVTGVDTSAQLEVIRFTGAPDEVTDAINKVVDEIGDQKDEFVAAAAHRILMKTEW